jgi:hypothetical protein
MKKPGTTTQPKRKKDNPIDTYEDFSHILLSMMDVVM